MLSAEHLQIAMHILLNGELWCKKMGFMKKKKNPAAVALGREGGKASAKTRTKEERAEYARKGWAKLKAKKGR